MNSITLPVPIEPGITPTQGDLFINPENQAVYLLARTNLDQYTAVSLTGGSRWRNSGPLNLATLGLKFLGRDAHIAITFPKP